MIGVEDVHAWLASTGDTEWAGRPIRTRVERATAARWFIDTLDEVGAMKVCIAELQSWSEEARNPMVAAIPTTPNLEV